MPIVTEEYRRSIEEYKDYTDEENFKYFKLAGQGIIVSSYPEEFENMLYESIAKLITNKYPGVMDKNDIIQRMSSYGRIYTAKLLGNKRNDRKAMYHLRTGNVLMYSWLNKLDTTIVHELLHKLSFLGFDESFYNMPRIMLETGTELVANEILEQSTCRENLAGDLWGRIVGVDAAYLVEGFLVNQFNQACGENLLQKSIIHGKDYISPKLEELVGKTNYRYFLEAINEICLYEDLYWDNDESEYARKVFEEKITEWQDDFMKLAFDKKFENVNTCDDAQKYLEELMKFSDYRVKGNSLGWKDDVFDEYFSERLEELSERFGIKFEIEDIQESWEERYPIIFSDRDKKKEDDERRKIDELAEKRKKRKGSIFRLSVVKRERVPKLDNPFRISDGELKRILLTNPFDIQSNHQSTRENEER